MRIAAILLAAGESRRYGERNKLLELVDGVPLVKRSASVLQSAGIETIYAVVGHEPESIAAALDSLSCRIVVNPNFGDGMGSSLAIGARGLDPTNWDGVLVCLSDLPTLSSEAVRSVCDAFEKNGGDQITFPSFKGKRGHPVCFPVRCVSQLASLVGDQGAKRIVKTDSRPLVEVPQTDAGCIQDLDTPAGH